VQQLGWKNWGQNGDEETQISVTEKTFLFQSYFNLLKTRLRVAAFPRAARA